jgi:hypothetical protein
LILFISAILIGRSGPDGAWARSLAGFAKYYGEDREIFTKSKPEDYVEPSFVRASARNAARALYVSAGVGAAIAAILVARRARPAAAYGLVALAVLELFVFARATRATMTPSQGFPDDPRAEVASTYRAWEAALRELPRDRRVLLLAAQFSNLGMSMGFDGIWGYDPLVLRRYAELLFASQENTDEPAQYLSFRQLAPGVFRTIRCALVLVPGARQPVVELPDALPVVCIVGKWIELPTRDAMFSYMLRDEFDPRRGVVVEADPGVASGEARVEGATVAVVASGTDFLDVRATVPRDVLLLVTNNYSRGWHARSLDPSAPQSSYTIIMANYAQQAVPLKAGAHYLRIEYAPIEFRVGAWVSILFTIGLVAGAVSVFRRGMAVPAERKPL